ncbi:hypothetical protein [Nocardia arthritidis]|uniref:Uncharacterized protein n=1 Tax=Nocardia arthritidis TaxID=228602 RepID=A0A6G9Y8X5_9NOCA|nr:hypothetical protein [Nocardia arthritidis]QIS09669.1 hypothetical protein F5544_08835 [Nocardia arthritidis]
MDDERRIWQVAVGLGLPDPTGPGSLDSEEIHPIALMLEESAHRIRGVNRIPCYTEFGPVIEIAEFAERVRGDAYDPAAVPVECTLTVYATDDELDELLPAIVADLGIDEHNYSAAAARTVTIGLRDIETRAEAPASYQHLVDQYRNRAVLD